MKRAEANWQAIAFDAEPTVDQVFEHLDRMLNELNEAEVQVAASQPEYERMLAEHIAEEARRETEAQAAREDAKRASEAKRLERATITWREDGTAIVNLHEALFAAADLDRDARFKSWVRKVESIDKAQQNGYCFVGDWIDNQTIEAKREYGVYLLASATGSRRNQTTDYAVVVMDANGILTDTGIATDDTDRGWALRIRDDVEKLLK